MIENLPPLPGMEPEEPSPSHTIYVQCGQRWVEVGSGFPHPDGKGHRLRFDIGVADGSWVEIRALDAKHYPKAGKRRSKGHQYDR